MGRVIIVQVWRPKFGSLACTSKPSTVVCAYNSSAERLCTEGQIQEDPEACYPTGLAEIVNSRISDRPGLKNIREKIIE